MMRSDSGFTLVEVLVALAVIAIALPALLVGLYQQIDATAYLRDKSFAQWVAANKLEETRILARRTRSLFKGNSNGVEEMGERQWFWWMASSITDVEQFYRVEIKVARTEEGEDSPLYTLTGYMSADMEAGIADDS